MKFSFELSHRLSITLALLCVLTTMPGESIASYGPFLHGDGIHSLGFGGVGIVAPGDTYALAANPALAIVLGNRDDFGLDLEQVYPIVGFRGNLFGRDDSYKSSFNNVPVPQAGFTRLIGDKLAIGSTAFAAGFGTDYRRSPYERFGGPDKASVLVGQTGITNALAWRPADNQAVGVGLNLSYQMLRVRGLQPFKVFSDDAEHFTDQGFDGAFGFGYSLGWQGWLTPWLEAGLAYRSKTWAQRFKDYAGVLPDQGRLEFPARYGAALGWHPSPRFVMALEFQRALFAEEKATGNGIDQLYQGNRLGSDSGPGFGWKNQNIYKLGVEWNWLPALTLRGGYSRGSKIARPGETLLSTIAPATLTEHYTVGASYERKDEWEISVYAALAPRKDVRGEDSVPLLAGDGEADVSNFSRTIGLSVGRRWY